MDAIENSADIIRKEFPDVAGIWLFGSAASGLESVESDIDLAVLPANKADKVKLWQCAQSIASKVGKEIDLIDLLDASTVLRAQVMQDGKLIYCADKLLCDRFETEALTDYLRFDEGRKELLEDIKSRGKVFDQDG